MEIRSRGRAEKKTKQKTIYNKQQNTIDKFDMQDYQAVTCMQLTK